LVITLSVLYFIKKLEYILFTISSSEKFTRMELLLNSTASDLPPFSTIASSIPDSLVFKVYCVGAYCDVWGIISIFLGFFFFWRIKLVRKLFQKMRQED